MIRPIKDFPGYTISSDGEVWSRKYNKQMKLINHGGYNRVTFSRKSQGSSKLVHRLVAEAFIPNPNNFRCVCHKNNIKTDNRVENLYWATHATNSLHAHRDGLANPARGVQSGGAKLNEEKVLLARLLAEKFGWSPSKVHRVFGRAWEIGLTQSYRIAKRESWAHI